MRPFPHAKMLACVAIVILGISTPVLAQIRPGTRVAPWIRRATATPGTPEVDGGAFSSLTDGRTVFPIANSIATPLAPTTSLPEDAAWEGWLAPGQNGSSLIAEYHGKLYLSGVVAAGHVACAGLVSWDGSHFEPGPPLPGPSYYTTAMTVWNDHLIVARSKWILMMNGAAWDTLGSMDKSANAMTVFGGDLVIGGTFTNVNGQPANRVARWNGSAWSALGGGFTGQNDAVYALTEHAGQLVAGGSLGANNVLSWNESPGVWQPLGLGLNSRVTSLESDGTTLYAAGWFTQSGASSVASNARWDGSNWLAVGPAFTDPGGQYIVTIWNGKAVFNRPMNNSKLAVWDGSQLSALGDSLLSSQINLGSYVSHVGTWGSKLVVTGGIYSHGGTPVYNILLYDGVTWSTPLESWDDQMLSPEGGDITDLISWNGKLIFGGAPQMAADHDHFVSCPGIGAWDGTHWSALGSGFFTTTYKYFGTYQGDLVAVGHSGNLGYVARWNGTAWSKFGTNPPRYGYAVQEYHNELYVAHDWVDGLTGGIARWDGVTWQSVGTGLSYQGVPQAAVGGALCVFGDSLVVVGEFDHAGDVPANNIALWDGAAWHAIGDAFTATLQYSTPLWTVASWNGHLVLGGGFTAYGTQPLQAVAIWDGASWQQLGTNAVAIGLLRVADGVLFAVGTFRLPDGTEIDSVARWTGTDWHILGSGSADIYAIAVHDGYLYESGTGLVNGHLSHNLSRIPLYATLDAPRPQADESRLMLGVSPNPARGSVALSFSLPTAGHVRLTLLDVSGREVARPADREFGIGAHQVAWPTAAAPGIYFARLNSPAGSRTARFVVLGR
jgi:trimeric autotransporter adhesin